MGDTVWIIAITADVKIDAVWAAAQPPGWRKGEDHGEAGTDDGLPPVGGEVAAALQRRADRLQACLNRIGDRRRTDWLW